MVIEHPARAPWQPSHVPSWDFPQTLHLSCHNTLLTIDQCRFGAPTRKRTHLLAIHNQPLVEYVHGMLAGRNDDGSFKTTPAK